MKISKKHRDILVKEINFARKKILGEKDPKRKAYFFSGTYVMLPRIFNLEYDPQLQFIHLVLQVAYGTIIQRINAIAMGDTSVPFPSNYFDKLDGLLGRLQRSIEKDENTYTILEKISNLTYLLSGNGHYLSTKGVKVFSE